MHARSPSDLHVKWDLSKYVNAGVKQVQGRGREGPCYRPPVVFGKKVKREGGKEVRGSSRLHHFNKCQKRFVGQGWENKNRLCASHACQQHQNPAAMCSLSNHAKEFCTDLYITSRTQRFRLPSRTTRKSGKKNSQLRCKAWY